MKHETVVVYPPAWYSGNPHVEAPDGTVVDTTGTTTRGIQEAIDYSFANDFDLHITGGEQEVDSGPIVYNCHSQLSFPPMQGKSITSGNITLNMNVNLGSDNGIVFDSVLISNVQLRGQIVYAGTGYAVEFKPRNVLPDVLAGKQVSSSSFEFCAIVVNKNYSGVGCVKFTLSEGSVSRNTFLFNEINDGDYGILVDTPASGESFLNNQVTCMNVHNTSDTAIKVGTSSTNDIYGNHWHVGVIPDSGTKGIDTFGNEDLWFATVHGVPSDGFTFNTGSRKNQAFFSRLLGTDKIVHASADYTNKVYIADTRTHKAITVGASPFIYRNVTGIPETVTVYGGTVSKILNSHDGVTFYSLCRSTDMEVHLETGMAMKVIYTVTPSIRRFC